MRVIYMAAPVSAPTAEGVRENLDRAKRWYRWIIKNFDVAVIADWLTIVDVLDDGSPDEREHGLEMDKVLVTCADEFWMVGGRISNGMGIELEVADAAEMRVVDLTFLGSEPPDIVMPEVMNLIGTRRLLRATEGKSA